MNAFPLKQERGTKGEEMEVKVLPLDKDADKRIVIYAGRTGNIIIDYDDVIHEEAEMIRDIIVAALKDA